MCGIGGRVGEAGLLMLRLLCEGPRVVDGEGLQHLRPFAGWRLVRCAWYEAIIDSPDVQPTSVTAVECTTVTHTRMAADSVLHTVMW